MKLLKKSFAWILVLCICVSLSPGGVSAATKIDSEPMDNASILADRAVEYVTRYVENAYLYEIMTWPLAPSGPLPHILTMQLSADRSASV